MSISTEYKKAVEQITGLVSKIAATTNNREDFLTRLDSKISNLNNKKGELLKTIQASIGLVHKLRERVESAEKARDSATMKATSEAESMLKKMNEEVPAQYLRELQPVMDKLGDANKELENVNDAFKKEFGFTLEEAEIELNKLEQEIRKVYGTDERETTATLAAAKSGKSKMFNALDKSRPGLGTSIKQGMGKSGMQFANVAMAVNKLLHSTASGKKQLEGPAQYTTPDKLNQFRGWKRTKDTFDLILNKPKEEGKPRDGHIYVAARSFDPTSKRYLVVQDHIPQQAAYQQYPKKGGYQYNTPSTRKLRTLRTINKSINKSVKKSITGKRSKKNKRSKKRRKKHKFKRRKTKKRR
jgi:hypothetical protein